MRTAALILYLVFSVVHLCDSYRDDARARARTKPFLLFFLILYYLFCAGDDIRGFLLAALIACWLGDVLLIPKGHGWFTAGGISFLFGHIFFILAYMQNIDYAAVPWLIVIPIALVYYYISVKIILALIPTTPKAMLPPMCLYLIANSTMNAFALMQLFTHKNAAAAIAYAGALLFFVSDCTLFLVRYYKNPNLIYRRHFTVMLTYLAGELLIVIGVLRLL
ncbi:MAG: lysoplasmalogenase [Lachnospiraceae bacterium]|nr:lysoplasmalogenase [Lachnospiraceae bacterium]